MNRVRLLKEMTGAADILPQVLHLQLPDLRIAVRSNSEALLNVLGAYFHPIAVVAGVAGDAAGNTADDTDSIEVVAWERPAPDLKIDWRDWPREAGKTGRKDTFVDLDGDDQAQSARLIYKVRTGMVFLQSMTHRIAAGPCLSNANQVINFINNQHMNA
ncbi:MAG: hypothetical protein Q9M82_01285, partial [Mariprofundus sp.]|nr:hypothetical protein [Mariprofundus sp.]